MAHRHDDARRKLLKEKQQTPLLRSGALAAFAPSSMSTSIVALPSANANSSQGDSMSWKKCLVKLHLDNEHVSSIPVRRLLAATESDTVSYSTLCRFTMLSAKFVKFGIQDKKSRTSDKPIDDKQYSTLRLHYHDEGDEILFTSDAELMEALQWTATKDETAPTLDVYAVFDSTLTQSKNQVKRQTSKKPPRVVLVSPSSPPEIEKLSLKPRNNPFAGFFRNMNTGSPRKAHQRQPGDPMHNFAHRVIHGLANVIGSAVTLIEEHQVSASQHGRRCSLASLQSETTDGGNDEMENLARLLRRSDGGGYRQVVLVEASAEVQKFDPKFVHKRHTCDGCKDFPIVGLRYHANPNIDLCQKCFDNASALPEAGKSDETVTFKLTQCRSDQCFVNSKLANALLKVCKCLKALPVVQKKVAPHFALPASPSELAANNDGPMLGESAKVSDFDVAMAIQRSLHDLRKAHDRSNVESGVPAKGMHMSLKKRATDASSTDNVDEPAPAGLSNHSNLVCHDESSSCEYLPASADRKEQKFCASVQSKVSISEAEPDSGLIYPSGSTEDADEDSREEALGGSDWCVVDG